VLQQQAEQKTAGIRAGGREPINRDLAILPANTTEGKRWQRASRATRRLFVEADPITVTKRESSYKSYRSRIPALRDQHFFRNEKSAAVFEESDWC
jgi:hypothetical protein